MSVCLFVCLSVSLSVCLSACSSVYLLVCLSVCLSACLPVCLSVLSVCLPVCLSVLSVCLSNSLYFCLSPWLSGCLTNILRKRRRVGSTHVSFFQTDKNIKCCLNSFGKIGTESTNKSLIDYRLLPRLDLLQLSS